MSEAKDVLQPAQHKIRAGGKPGRVDPRGNSASRRRRSEKLVTDPQWKGNGKSVPCVHCGKVVHKNPPKDRPDLKLEQDRKVPGGPYAYHNIQPSCPDCNKRRSNNSDWKYDG